MKNIPLILLGKSISIFSKLTNLGNGSTWSGHIVLKLNRNFIKNVLKNSKTQIILVAGTNGKTTTSSLLKLMLEKDHKKVLLNSSGANLINGIASSIIQYASLSGSVDIDFAIFEIDENTLPIVIKTVSADIIVLLNLFRDQLDRYGEIHTIAKKWKEALEPLTDSTALILNADDPQVAYLGKDSKARVYYFGINDQKLNSKISDHASDSTYCPNCDTKLVYALRYFSHLGIYECQKCGFKRPKPGLNTAYYPLPGVYNMYNTLAAQLAAEIARADVKAIFEALHSFTPVFGRQEIIKYKDRNIQIFLSKNPTSFNQSFKTISELGARTILIVLNDRIPDGRDVSWIWDTELTGLDRFQNIIVSGDRVYDMALRVKYEIQNSKFKIYESLKTAIDNSVKLTTENETLYILPTYSAMLEVRKILTGRKIL